SISFVLVACACLLIQSLQRLQSASPGFETGDLLVTGVNLLAAGYDEPHAVQFQERLSERVTALPGGESAAYARGGPFGHQGYDRGGAGGAPGSTTAPGARRRAPSRGRRGGGRSLRPRSAKSTPRR